MKNLIIALCIFAVTLAGIIVTDIIMKNNADEILVLCDKLIEETQNNDWDKINSAYESINLKWKDSKQLLFFVLNHTDIDNVDFALNELKCAIDEKDSSYIKNYAQNLKFYVDELLDTEDISWENIL